MKCPRVVIRCLALVWLLASAASAQSQRLSASPARAAPSAAAPLTAASALTPASSPAQLERARIDQARDALTRSFDADEAECRRRFAVSDCLADVAKRRRGALAELRRQELVVNDAERARRAEARERRLADKQDAAAARPAPSGDAARGKPRPEPGAEPTVESRRREPESARGAPPPRSGASAVQRYQDKLERAARQRAAAEQRQAGRSKPPASSLPVPP